MFSQCNLICNLSHQLRRFKLQKRAVIKMVGDKALVMIPLVIILAIFLRRKRIFIQRMRLMSLQMRRMRRNANPTTKQHSVIRVRGLSESSFSSVCTSFLTVGLSLNFRVIRLGPPFRIPGFSSLGKPYRGSVSPPVFGPEYPVKVHNVRLRRH